MANYRNLREEKLLPLCSVRSQGTSSSSLTVRMGFCTLYSLTFSFPLSVFAHSLSPPFVTLPLKHVEGNIAASEGAGERASGGLSHWNEKRRRYSFSPKTIVFMIKYGSMSMSQ